MDQIKAILKSLSMHVSSLTTNKKCFWARYLYYRADTINLQNLQFLVLTGHIFFFLQKGNTELKSLCITRRLMLIDICFMKIS